MRSIVRGGGEEGHASRRLLEACKAGNVEAAKQAIADGADVDARDKCGSFPLGCAVDPYYGNNVKIVEILIEVGCQVNQTDADGCTALYWAVGGSGGSVGVVDTLLRAGADPYITNWRGDTSCHCLRTAEVNWS